MPAMEMPAGGARADRVDSMLRQGGAGSCSPAASQAPPGEAAAVIMRRGPRAARMLDGRHAALGLQVGPGRRMPPLDAAVLGVVRDPGRAAPGLDTAGRAILARALADPHSIFLTRDQAILANSEIVPYEEGDGEGRRKARLDH